MWCAMTPDAALRAATAPTVDRIGPRAARVLASGMRGRVLAVFRRSFYLTDTDDRLVCIGHGAIGAGPLNALCPDGGSFARLISHVDDGAAAAVEGTFLHIDGAPELSLTGGHPWCPRAWLRDPSPKTLRHGLKAASAMAEALAPEDGLGAVTIRCLAPGSAAGLLPATPLGRCATPGLAALAEWLDAGADTPVPDAVFSLVGLGPGLTPSGDDLLGGALIALAALGEHRARRTLGQAVCRAAKARTGTISRAHLDCAADGQGAEALHAVLADILLGRTGHMAERMAALGRVGHCSGWDALAGAALVLRRHAGGTS